MPTTPITNRYVAHSVMCVGILLAIPLWREFREPAQPLWNGFLAIFLTALIVGSFIGIRYLQKNRIEVGEARFPTTDSKAD